MDVFDFINSTDQPKKAEYVAFGQMPLWKICKVIKIADSTTELGSAIRLILRDQEGKELMTYTPDHQYQDLKKVIDFLTNQSDSQNNPFLVPLKMNRGRRALFLPHGEYILNRKKQALHKLDYEFINKILLLFQLNDIKQCMTR